MNIQAIIFDCDGTLVDTESIENRLLVEYAAEFGFSVTYERAVELFAGIKMAVCVSIIEQEIGRSLPDDFIPVFRQRCVDEFERGLTPLPGVVETLEQLTHPYCVASNGPLEKMEITLGLTGLQKFFGDRVYSAYEIECWKPDPGLFLYAAAQMEVAPQNCLVVEDSPTGVTAGVAAGMNVVAYRTEGLALDIARQVHFIEDFAEVMNFLKR